MIEDLDDSNYLMAAIKAYTTPRCLMSEFGEDLKRVNYVKRLFKKYRMTGDLKDRLILNHIIILGNVFGVEMAVRLLFLKVDPQDYKLLKTFLLFLEYMPKVVQSIKGSPIVSADIGIDFFIVQRLREI